jgi:hypothetical protein
VEREWGDGDGNGVGKNVFEGLLVLGGVEVGMGVGWKRNGGGESQESPNRFCTKAR